MTVCLSDVFSIFKRHAFIAVSDLPRRQKHAIKNTFDSLAQKYGIKRGHVAVRQFK